MRIFFDFDGVLIDSLKLWENACQYAALTMGFKGAFPKHPYAKINPVSHKYIGESLGLDGAEFEKLADGYFLEHCEGLNFFEGTAGMLKSLSEEFELYILSASNEIIVKTLLENAGFLRYFQKLFCAGNKAEILMKFKDARSIMIGDAISDVEAALRAEVFCIAVLWGWQDEEMLKQSQICVKNHEELEKQIRKFYENHSND